MYIWLCRALSSVGLEHLIYTEGVRGSNPLAPTYFMKIPILYEDKDILVINKPAGLVVHSDGRTKEKTLVDWILKKYPKTKKVGEPITLNDGTVLKRPGIVHRIDRDTSGVLVIAKTQPAFLFLKKQFQ